jgi:LPXTG-motif cell wall-anchored protein
VTPLITPLRRAAAILVGVLIGLTGLAAPAAATTIFAGPPAPDRDVVVTGDLIRCNEDNGKWMVEWTISNWYLNTATISDLAVTPVPIEGLTDGSLILSSRSSPRYVLTQQVPGDATLASVSFTATLINLVDRDNSYIVPLDGVCKERDKPCVTADKATFHHEFAVSATEATATVTLDDRVKLCAPEPVSLATYFAPKPEFSVPQFVFDHQTDTISNERPRITLVAAVPACNTEVDLFFGGESDVIETITEDGPRYGDRRLGSPTGPGARSTGKPGWFNGGNRGCDQPDVTHDDKCDGVVAVHLSNTGDISRFAVDFTVTAGSFSRSVTVRPGKAETVEVPAGAGEITVAADGMPTKKFSWKRPADCPVPAVVVTNDCQTVTATITNPEGVVPATAEVTYAGAKKSTTVAPGATGTVTFPAASALEVTIAFPGLGLDPVTAVLQKPDCSTPTPSPSTPTPSPSTSSPAPGGGGGDPGLPITGTATTTVAVAAAILLIAGAVLMIVTRRRRTRFTA